MTRQIIITPVLNGFIVNVGCQTVVFSTPKELGAAVAEYYTKPGTVEMRYRQTAINRRILGEQPPTPAPVPWTGAAENQIRWAVGNAPAPTPPR